MAGDGRPSPDRVRPPRPPRPAARGAPRASSASACSRPPRPSSPRVGYAEASAEAISREAGMSKATFYEHFANKEECILALFDAAAAQVTHAMARGRGRQREYGSYDARMRAGVRAFLDDARRPPRLTPRRCSSRSSAPARARPRAATRSSRPSPTSCTARTRARRRALRRAAVRVAPTTRSRSSAPRSSSSSRQLRTGQPDADRARASSRSSTRLHRRASLDRRPSAGRAAAARLARALEAEVVACRALPAARRVARAGRARQARAAFADEEYWGRPIPGFGDPAARVLVLGLAPAAHGANRTGRVFTGDRSGDLLFAALHRAGLRQPADARRTATTGCALHDAWITAAVRCAPPANKPTPAERDTCLPWAVPRARAAAARPVDRLPRRLRVGRRAAPAPRRRAASPRPRPRFGHGACSTPATGCRCSAASTRASRTRSPARLTEPMLDAVLARARDLVAR